MIDLYITSLKITSEDKWLERWIKNNGDQVRQSPQYLYLCGETEPLEEWMKFRKLPLRYMAVPLMNTLQSLIKDGQKEEILVYKDSRINTGHKRAACLLWLGHTEIDARFVDDDYKL